MAAPTAPLGPTQRLVLGVGAAQKLLDGLREGREALLAPPARELARALGAVGERFLDPDDPLRQEALALLPMTAGLSPEMARVVLDGMAADWSAARLEALLDADLGGGAALDGFVPAPGGRRVRALGPPLTFHLCAGTVPGVSVTSLLRSLLVRSAVLLKPGRGDEVLPVLFRRGLEESAPRLAAALAVVYWPGGAGEPLERVALAEADLVVVYGSDETVAVVRAGARASTPVVAHPHRVGFGVVGAGALTPGRIELAADEAARAVALFDQRGCVSAHQIYALGADAEAVQALGGALAAALERLEGELPPGPTDPSTAGATHQLRGTAELLEVAGRGRVWSGGVGAGWTVTLSDEPDFSLSCLGRVVRVAEVPSVEALMRVVHPYRRHLQTVGVHGLEDAERLQMAEALARMGGGRITPLAGAPWPPPWWHHDGMGPLIALVRWTDLEA